MRSLPLRRDRLVLWLLSAIALAIACLAWLLLLLPGAPPATPTAPPALPRVDEPFAKVERGKYLVAAGDCVSCHTRSGGVAFAGGVRFDTPYGAIYSPNITPDNETGIGRWAPQDLRLAMHEGLAPGGRHLFPAFPYDFFTKVSDNDVDAIYAYLRTLKAERYRPPRNDLLFTQRWVMALWNSLYFKAGRFKQDPAQSAEWNVGAYLVEGLGHCGACHTPRNRFMAEVAGQVYAGGALADDVAPGKVRRWSAVNLTTANVGLGSWTLDDLTRYLKTGFSARAGVFGPMNGVVVNGTGHLTTADVRSIAVYLKSLPAQRQREQSAAITGPAGAAIYKARCEMCHMSSGRGGFFNAPPLAGSAIVQAADPASLINVVLYGPVIPKGVSLGAWETMKPYSGILSDQDLAAVCNYVRTNWGNAAPSVTSGDVSRQR